MWLFVVFVGCFSFTIVYAQQPPDTLDVEQDLETAIEFIESEDGDLSQIADQLIHIIDNPVDLNTATLEELAQIPSLTPLLAGNIIRYRSRAGPFESMQDLEQFADVDSAALSRMLPYVTVYNRESIHRNTPVPVFTWRSLVETVRKMQFEFIQRYTRRIEVGRGYDRDSSYTAYLGSPVRNHTRLRAHFGKTLEMNITLEKDPGEVFSWNFSQHAYGYDYISANVLVSDLGPLKTLIIGDYVVNVGQGVVLWRSSEMGKGRQPVRPTARLGSGIKPYGSTEENRFFRGVAAAFGLARSLTLSTFISSRTLDASIAYDSVDDTFSPSVSSITNTGLHRTKHELEQKDTLKESFWGGNLSYTTDRLHAGLVTYRSTFSHAFLPGSQLFQRFLFRGRHATMTGAYFSAFLGNALLFSEIASDPANVIGGLGGILLRLPMRVETVVLVRHYPKDFVSIHGNPFGERMGTAQNETGVYTGIRLFPARTWTVSAYFDQYAFPWIRFGIPRPSTGYDVLLSLEIRPRAWLRYYLEGRSETQETRCEVPATSSSAIDAVDQISRQSIRLHGEYSFSRRLRLSARMELKRYTQPGSECLDGILLYQDFRWTPRKRFQIDIRYAFFDIDDYTARIYTYESDLLYSFAVPAFQGKGRRFYILLRWNPVKNMTIQCKFSRTQYEGIDKIGSGLDEINGNQVRDIRFQIRWKF